MTNEKSYNPPSVAYIGKRKDPIVWFCQMEAIFKLSIINTDRIKYVYVQAHLEDDIQSEIRDFLDDLSKENQYEAPKKRLIAEYTKSPDYSLLEEADTLTHLS